MRQTNYVFMPKIAARHHKHVLRNFSQPHPPFPRLPLHPMPSAAQRGKCSHEPIPAQAPPPWAVASNAEAAVGAVPGMGV